VTVTKISSLLSKTFVLAAMM